MRIRILSKLHQILCRILLFMLGWKSPNVWYDVRREHRKIIAVIPEVLNWNIVIYYLIYWGYLAERDKLYIWKNISGWNRSNKFLEYCINNVPYIPCFKNHLEFNRNSVTRTYNILKDYEDWSLIVTSSSWFRKEYRDSGYYYLALALHADIVSLELNCYTKSLQILNIIPFEPNWMINNKFSEVNSEIKFVNYESYTPENLSPRNKHLWTEYFLSPIDYNLLLPTLVFIINLVISYYSQLFIFYPLLIYLGLWWWQSWNRIYETHQGQVLLDTCHNYHYLLQGVLLTEIYYKLSLGFWTNVILIIIYIITWDGIRGATIFSEINELGLNLHLQISLLLALYFTWL